VIESKKFRRAEGKKPSAGGGWRLEAKEQAKKVRRCEKID